MAASVRRSLEPVREDPVGAVQHLRRIDQDIELGADSLNNRISGQNNKKGAWVQLNGGARWSPRKPPTGPAGYFKEG